MADEFNPINTQEEFDAAVRERYGDVAGLQGQIDKLTGERDGHANTIAELRTQVAGYQKNELKSRIAREEGIPADMASRLVGDDEKALRADAKALSGNLRALKGAAPLAEEGNKNDEGKRAGLRAILRGMKGD